MPKRLHVILFFAGTLLPATAFAKDSMKGALPQAVLRAHTVAVIVDPEAGVVLTDPQANQVAQRDVEQALQTWGRFTPVLSLQAADLIVVVRRGHNKIVQLTVSDPRQNSRVGEVIPGDGGIGIGARRGRDPAQQRDSSGNPAGSPSPRIEATSPEDVFTVYTHDSYDPNDSVDSPPAWRYVGKNALKPHTVPAVEEFRKALVVADKIAAGNP